MKIQKKLFDYLMFVMIGLMITNSNLAVPNDQLFSLVINHGRVIDPETGLDGIRHLGIQDDQIIAVSPTPLKGEEEIDATGLVVSPGFIDLHTHSPTELGQYYQLFDGVTTALELEAGTYPADEYGARISEKPLINYGASAGYVTMRLLEKNGISATDPIAPMPANLEGVFTALKLVFMDFDTVMGDTFAEKADTTELQRLRAMLLDGLQQGALGIGLALDYVSEAVNPAELKMIFEVAGEHGAPIFIHIRRGINGDPFGLHEVIKLAEQTGAPIHICHISHSAMRNIDQFLKDVSDARSRGVDITAEVLPYNAGSTAISSAVFGRHWQKIFNISYQDVEWAATGERFNKDTFQQYRKEQPQGMVIHHYLKEEWTIRALQEPGVMVVSDLLPIKSKKILGAPHNGAFSRVLGRYVREKKVIDLPTALGKMTLLPAQRLQKYAPIFAKKGRIQEGMDADITIFDADKIIDKASYRDPYQEAEGLTHVVVNGTVVVCDGALVEGIYPGRRLRR